ncbi:ATP-binding protein [Kaistia dalseonensis]|uniref:histidine kinase n=1 Tax=Kaistia dalseonensis TaxID=410840 RepID=A0ABU0H2U3_9HYPH|nr:ATP-binding protein [Kaistia dalseonensis]MCX5494046.1 ATP-binding protein [Kaistia dalseonensis]MDQ0436624.1 two-component system C4-dicarboxylate transport sensor histidine kinase DctB [Kaistia dalseonensis]
MPRLLLIVLALVLLIGLDRFARFGAERWALSQLRTDAQAAAELRVSLVRSEIEKQRTLPIVLAQDPDMRAALESRDAARLDALDAKFEQLAIGTRAGAIYLLDNKGVAIAASNYRTATSFVGSNYAFRPYYLRAMAEGSAEHFAFGTVSKRPGLYLTRRLDGPNGPLGVLVVKAEFEAIEADWRRFVEPTFVTDDRAIVLVTSVPEWRFQTTGTIPSEQKAEIRTSLQFGDAELTPLPITVDDAASATIRAKLPADPRGRQFVEATAAVPTTDWMLHVLAPTEAAVNLATAAGRSLALLVGVLGLGAAGFWLLRRQRLLGEQTRQAAMRRDLEERVAARTAELSAANDQLRAEMAERRRARLAMQAMQDDLVQASKLAVLGQIAASVAHEVNQPVAAIRTFAENAELLLARGDTGMVRSNLSTITTLTERIGAITGELRAFARKTPGEVEHVSLRGVIDGAHLLVGHRLREQEIALSVEMAEADIIVVAARVRLEQVFVNLLQNAIEALSGQTDGRIRIDARTEGERVTIIVADNGPGLPPEVMSELFMPFTTTKPKGLGLGLVISNDIIAECGGTFVAENRDGAVFTITLPRAL